MDNNMYNIKWKNKYLKYKKKYLFLKELIGGEDTPKTIYNLFINSPISLANRYIITVQKADMVTPLQPSRVSSRVGIPVNKDGFVSKWTHFLTTVSRVRAKLDDADQEALEALSKDEDYNPEDEKGKLIEEWLAENMKCPCCNEKSLRLYFSQNMPVVDLVCINEEHSNNRVRFFQVKSRNINSQPLPFFEPNTQYFDITDIPNNYIHVGSRKKGEFSHSIKTTDPDKSILIGYICVEYNNTNDEINILNSSIVILPNLDYKETEEFYYNYLDPIKPIIRFNPNPKINSISNVRRYLDTFTITNFVKNYIKSPNPLAKSIILDSEPLFLSPAKRKKLPENNKSLGALFNEIDL